MATFYWITIPEASSDATTWAELHANGLEFDYVPKYTIGYLVLARAIFDDAQLAAALDARGIQYTTFEAEPNDFEPYNPPGLKVRVVPDLLIHGLPIVDDCNSRSGIKGTLFYKTWGPYPGWRGNWEDTMVTSITSGAYADLSKPVARQMLLTWLTAKGITVTDETLEDVLKATYPGSSVEF